MRSTGFIIVFSIIIGIYGLVNYYLYVRGLQAFSFSGQSKKWYVAAFIAISASFVAGIFLERGALSVVSEWIFRIGSLWLAFMLYFGISLLLIDVIRILNHFFHFLPPFSEFARLKTGIVVVAIVSVWVFIGYLNTVFVNIRKIPVRVEKKVDGDPHMRVLMASDLHLGAIIGQRREKKLLDIIHEQQPDLVLFCGDLVDSEIAPVLRKNLGVHLQEIEAPLGVYAILGNHEYIGGIGKTLPYLESINIKTLVDSVVILPNGVQLVGRNDRAAGGFKSPSGQKPLRELLAGTDSSKPVFVMNHQPYNLDEPAGLNVDLHLSGHTHNGQLWPFNYITGKIFELSWGYLKKGNTHFYVSCGYGTWGPLVRTGSQSEVVVFDIDFIPPGN